MATAVRKGKIQMEILCHMCRHVGLKTPSRKNNQKLETTVSIHSCITFLLQSFKHVLKLYENSLHRYPGESFGYYSTQSPSLIENWAPRITVTKTCSFRLSLSLCFIEKIPPLSLELRTHCHFTTVPDSQHTSHNLCVTSPQLCVVVYKLQ